MPDFDYDLGVLSMQLAVSRVKANVFLNRGVSSLTVIAQYKELYEACGRERRSLQGELDLYYTV